jgi:arylsulfatase A-like enzyme
MMAGAAVAASAQQSAAAKPNLIILYADDMGYGDVGFNGRKEWSTPNLDRFGSQGTIFDRWYTAFPVCAPSRACLLTGRYTIHHGVRANSVDIPKEEVTLAEALKQQGYKTALFGKWHRGRLPDGSFTHPLDQGFDETFGYLDALHAWEHFPKMFWRGRTEEPVSGYSCDIIANEAIRFFKQNRSHPFFLYLPFIEPHFYIESPPENVAKFKGKFAEKNPAEPFNAHYAGMIERLDAAIGRVLKSLDELGLAQNTLIVFSSDNGATFETGNKGASNFHDSNRPFRGQKRSLEEGGIRMPSIVRWPGKVPAGKRSQIPIHMTDVMPSMLAAAGGTPDPAWKVDGHNMLDVWMGKSKGPDRTIFWEFNIERGSMLAAMRGDFKYLQIGENGFLYDLSKDPTERRTVAQEYPEIFAQLRKETHDWMANAKPLPPPQPPRKKKR